MEQRPAIFKLNLDCFDRVFDYLPLKDLRQFSQTCKTMKAAVGKYYQVNFGTIEEIAGLGKENLYLAEYNTMGFSDFVEKLHLYQFQNDEDGYVKRDLSRKVIALDFNPNDFTKPQLHRLKYIINNAEVLSIHCGNPNMSKSICEMVPSMCDSLKRLHMKNFECDEATETQDENKWLLREYPTLEHLEWTQSRMHGYKINGIKAFFELNPNVRSFTTNVNCLWESCDLIIESGVKLNDLTIKIYPAEYDGNPLMMRGACILLTQLYEKGAYKRLHLKFTGREHQIDVQSIQQTIDQIIPINAVRSISLPKCNLNLTKVVNLVELQIIDYEHCAVPYIDMMAKCLVNLHRVELSWASLGEMQSFIYHSVKLKELRVVHFLDKTVSALDLANMNKRREQLLEASKVTIFIEEEVYLATKWALKSTDFHLIEMMRSTAHEWGHHFGPCWYA